MAGMNKMIAIATVLANTEKAQKLVADHVTSDDVARSASYRSPGRQKDFLLARAALRALLAETVGVGDFFIEPDAGGKPLVVTGTGKVGPHISLSHTNGLIACAVAQHEPIGVDVECWAERDFSAIARYAFGAEECREVEDEGASAFYRIWTAREALAKRDGHGVFKTFDGQDHASRRCLENLAGGGRVFHLTPAAAYTLALATTHLLDATDGFFVIPPRSRLLYHNLSGLL